MKPSEIFNRNQILTIQKAKELKGKRIAVTNEEYKDNTPDVSVFVVGDIISEWNLSEREPMEGYANHQQYLKSYMSREQILSCKNRVKLLDDQGNVTRCTADFRLDDYPFWGSDSDRWIYYVEVE